MRIPALMLSSFLLAAMAAAQPAGTNLCDLDVLYLQRTPKYPGYQPQYGLPGRQGEPWLTKVGEDGQRVILTPAEVDAQQRWPREGQPVTYTAVVENKGDADAPPFEFTWYVDGAPVETGQTEQKLPAGERVELAYTWTWDGARHEIALWADPMRRVRQYSYSNDRRPVWTHAKLLICYADSVTYASFAESRNFLGTYSFEDWCQAHADWMNLLFERSIYPVTAPDGILDRVAVDFIGVLDDDQAKNERWRGTAPLAEGWDGGWWFGRREDCSGWAAGMDWGLIHEWGHQLGLTDLYQLDVAPENNLVLDDAGAPLLIGHMCIYRGTMMHGHGPVAFSEDQAIALNHQLWRRRGYYGDYYYNLAAENSARVLDAEGRPVADARLRFWQRGPDHVLTGEPTFTGTTGADGTFLLPNRRAPAVVTHGDAGGGYALRPNPFGLINVVGGNGVMLVEITARGQTDYAWLEIPQFNIAKEQQGADAAVVDLATHLPPPDGPPAPSAPEMEIRGQEVTLRLDGADRWLVLRADPTEYGWKVVGEAEGGTFVDRMPRSGLFRYAAAVERGGKRSARSKPVGVASLVDPWGLALEPDGTAYVRDRVNGQTLMIRPDGSAVGFIGSVHWHLEGSYDHATDAKGRLYVAKWPDGYDPKRAWIRRIDPRGLGREHDRKDLAGGEFESDAPGRFRKPMGIWVSPVDGTIVVADTGNDRVQILTAEGAVTPGGMVTGLAQPHKALLAGERLVVCDTKAGRVVILARESEHWRETAALDDFEEPTYACLGPGDDVWIADRGLGQIVAIDPAAGRRMEWRYPAAGRPAVEDLRGIAYDAGQGDLLYLEGQTKRLVRVHVQD